MQERRNGTRRIMGAVGAMVVLAAVSAPAAAPAQTAQGQAQMQAQPPAIERALESRSKGADDATVVVFEIADFQCPYCAQFATQVGPELHEMYVATGQVQWVFVNLPMHNHPRAWHAAEAALCAGAAGDQFWPMHDRLFQEQEQWVQADDPQAAFARYAADLGVPMDAYQACTRDDEVAALILQDLGSAVSAGITGTPTFVIMKGQQVVDRVVGLQPIEDWRSVLEGALGADTGGE